MRTAVVEAINALLPDEGYRACAEGEEPDREIVIAADDETRWISIYDQASEDQSGLHTELAKSLSKTLSAAAVSILVHDSDVLDMTLFENGRTLDEFCNWPGYFEGGRKRHSGKESAWQPVLRSGAKPSTLKKAWQAQAKSIDAGDELQEILPVLGMNTQLASVGYNYLAEIKLPKRKQTRLAFRRRERPAQ